VTQTAPVVGYTVAYQFDGSPGVVTTSTTAALTVTVGNLTPGATYSFRVTSVDDTADQSPPSTPDAVLAVPRAGVTIGGQLRHGSRPLAGGGCGTVSHPCVQTALAGDTFSAQLAPSAWSAHLATRIERRYRKPGTALFRDLGSLAQTADGNALVRVGFGVHGIALLPGITCLRATTDDAAATLAAAGPWRCLRFRPPVTIGWAGDTTLGSAAYGHPSGDGRSGFQAVLGLLQAPDLMIGNYEGTLSHGGHPRCTGGSDCFIFQAAPSMAEGLRYAGFDVMNLSNNHGLDMGAAARAQTARALSAHHVGVTGLPGQITMRQVADTRVALVGFGFTPGTMDLDDTALVRAMVRTASRSADVVVVIMHSGIEGAKAQHVPSGDEAGRGRTRNFVATAIAAGADLVVGSGPHVVRGIEQRHRRLAFYSSGNFSGWHNFAMGGVSSESGIVNVTLDFTGANLAARFIGLHLTGPGTPVTTGGAAVVRHIARLSREDFRGRAPNISSNGRITLK